MQKLMRSRARIVVPHASDSLKGYVVMENREKSRPTLSLGILSWRAHETLRQTLSTYAPLMPLVDEKIIYFNAITPEDRALAEEFGFEPRGGAANLGILGGTRALVHELSGDLVMLCQNDNPINVLPDVLAARLDVARASIARGEVKWVRVLDRFARGFSNAHKFERYWDEGILCKLRRMVRPDKASQLRGRAVNVFENPEERFPEIFRRSADGLLISSSRWVNYSDQPFMAQRDFMIEALDWADSHADGYRGLNGMAVPEIVLNSSNWWRNGNFPIGISDGVFTHRRLDDSFRSNNRHFNPDIVGK